MADDAADCSYGNCNAYAAGKGRRLTDAGFHNGIINRIRFAELMHVPVSRAFPDLASKGKQTLGQEEVRLIRKATESL